MQLLFSISLFFLSISCFGSEAIFDVKMIPLIIDPELDFWFYTPPNTGPNVFKSLSKPNFHAVYAFQSSSC